MPELDEVFLSLIRVDREGRVRPRLSRANHRTGQGDRARRVRTIGPPVSFEWIQGIHDVPLQRPEAVARRIARFAEAAPRVRRRHS